MFGIVLCRLPFFFFQDHSLHRCSISASSQTDNSDSEDTTDDENIDIKNNGYHDAENEVDPETEDDCYRRLSGKLSESSGSAASDLYDYKVISLTVYVHTSFIFIYFSL